MTRDEARIRVHRAIIEAGHVDRVDSILADLLMTVRAEAFEEAAKVCDRSADTFTGFPITQETCEYCAEDIRAHARAEKP